MNARRLLAKRGAMTLKELAEAIAGEKISGSWWSHPKGKLIFNVTSALEDAPGVLACKLGGRVTFLDEALFPALYRVVTDESFQKRAPAAARAVAKRAARGPIRLTAEQKKALGNTCILHVASEHTDAGAHATVARTWESWASAETKSQAADLGWDEALAALATHGVELG